MSAESHLARRYLGGLRRRTHVATVTLISLVGLGLGVMALVVTLALLDGFQTKIRDDLVRSAAHAEIVPASGRSLDDVDDVVSFLQTMGPHVEWVLTVNGTCLVVSAADAVPAAVIGRSDTSEVSVDHPLAARLGIGAGDGISVISPRRRLTPMGPLPVRLPVTVRQIRKPEAGSAGLGHLRLDLAGAQKVLWGRAEVDAIEVRDATDPWGVGDRVRKLLSERDDLRVLGMRELHQPLLLALALERVLIFVAVGLILLVAALNLLCNVAMVAAEKRRDLAVLAGMGLAPERLRRLFLMLGLAIGAIGAVSGGLAGVVVSVFLDRTGLIPLPSGAFARGSIPFTVDPATVVLVIAIALGLSAAASWVPARMVARREPAEGLRYE
jgi:lipoprotein-releasing system permease protein